MEYRRFGKTNKHISAITLGGMRFIHNWEDPRDEIPADTREHCRNVVQMALDYGINHIETAYGYKKSEHAFGKVLNEDLKIDRGSYYLMTKGDALTAGDMRRMVEEQLTILQTDYFDFYGWHGMNNADLYKKSCAKNGPVEELLKLKEEGIIHHVGFSSHAPVEVIMDAINTDLFEFVNLHYYYFFQHNKLAIDLAASKDMGVFIISPNDKGGKLYEAPDKLKELVAPSTPIQWNARFCLGNSAVHTLAFGMTKPLHFEEMTGIFPSSAPLSKSDQTIQEHLNNQLLHVPYADYDGYDLQDDPSGINIPEVLRFRRLLKGYDMKKFSIYRYNMFGDGHWFPGKFPTEENMGKIDMSKVPDDIPLKELILETHQELFREKKNS